MSDKLESLDQALLRMLVTLDSNTTENGKF